MLQALLFLLASQTLIQIGNLSPRHKKGYAPDVALRLGLGGEPRYLCALSAFPLLWNGVRSPK